jgi:serine/threonine-protein kinase
VGLTLAGGVIGTPAYMSPEQARSESVDARTDVYSLGCMTFEMLTGQRPFQDYGIHAIGLRTTSPAPCTTCPDLPAGLDAVLARALAPTPDDRFQSTTAFAEALGAAASPVSPAIDTQPRVATRPAWRRSWIAAATLALATSITAGVVLARRAATGAMTGSAMPAPMAGPSLAVLPFENLGAAADAYFVDGMSDGLVSRLTSVAGVRVMSSHSTRLYRNTDKSRDQIARELGVDYLLDGRVRWNRADSAARRVRVTVELVRIRDGSSIWADNYEAKSDDLFNVEGQIGERVATALEVTLGARERKTIAARPTENFEAYSFYLRGEALRLAEEDAINNTPRAIQMFERAVALDPKFALAYARLGKAHMDLYWANTDRTTKRLALAKAAAETALRLDPDLPQAHFGLAHYYFWAVRNYDRAFAELAAAEDAQPGSSEIFAVRAGMLRRTGRMREAIANFERALELDPRTPQLPFNIANIHGAMRNYSEAVRYLDRTLAVNPRWAGIYADRAMFMLGATGDVDAARRSLRDGMALPDAGKIIDRFRFKAALFVGYTARDSAVIRSLTPELFRADTAQYMIWTADYARRQAHPALVRAYADSGRAILERRVAAEPREAFPRMQLATAYALLNRKADALREAARATEILPVSLDGNDGVDLQEDYAFVETLVGETESAVKRLTFLLSIPSDVSLNLLRHDPMWDPLRANAGFERLIKRERESGKGQP